MTPGIRILVLALLLSCNTPRQDNAPLCYAYTELDGEEFVIYAAPGSDEVLMTLPGKYDYDLVLCSPQEGWWKLLSPVSIIGVPDDEDEELDIMLPAEGWIPARSAHFATVMRRDEPLVLRESPSESSAAVASIPPGDVWALYPLDLRGDDWVKVQQVETGPVGWLPRAFICTSTFEVCYEEFPDEEEDE